MARVVLEAEDPTGGRPNVTFASARHAIFDPVFVLKRGGVCDGGGDEGCFGVEVIPDPTADSIIVVYFWILHRPMDELAQPTTKHVFTVYRKSSCITETTTRQHGTDVRIRTRIHDV